ncbi:MAG: hypothetical protein RML40_12270, partial [Bacteroidota bacterium]|nr:hypothetical protein [Bacteroidota bacterium]
MRSLGYAQDTAIDGSTGAPPDSLLRVRPSLGVIAAGNLNYHRANFSQLPGIDVRTQAPAGSVIRFTDGFSVGFSAGVACDIPLSESMGIGMRMMYSSLNAPLTATETIRIGFLSADGNSVSFRDAVIGWSLENFLGLASVQILALLRPFSSAPLVRFLLGADVGMFISRTFAQSESIVNLHDEPQAVFNNLSKNRNPQSGNLPQGPPIYGAIVGGVGYDIPLSSGNATTVLTPEITYAFGVTPIVTGIQWNADVVRASMTLRFVIPEPPPPPPPPPPPILKGEIAAFRVDSNGAEFPLIRLKVEETTSKQLYPILPFIFFDQYTDTLPA